MSSNAARIFEQFYNGDYAHKGDQIRLIDDEIYSKGTLIGKIENLEYYDGEYELFLVLSLQTFRSQKNWKTHQKQLAKAANETGVPVIIVPELDIGFGLGEDISAPTLLTYHDVAKDLITVAKYSEDEDVKTAACAVLPGYLVKKDKVIAYSYNQKIDGGWMHAEQVLCSYLQCVNNGCSLLFYSLLEPCHKCLTTMIESDGDMIVYGACHKDKWNTPEYIQYTNDISNKEIRSNSGRPISYYKVSNRVTNKFYKLEDKK